MAPATADSGWAIKAPELAAPNAVAGVAGTDTLLAGRDTDALLARSGV
jgi:hypothetical protein